MENPAIVKTPITTGRLGALTGLTAAGSPPLQLVTLNGEFRQFRVLEREETWHTVDVRFDQLANILDLPNGDYRVVFSGIAGIGASGVMMVQGLGTPNWSHGDSAHHVPAVTGRRFTTERTLAVNVTEDPPPADSWNAVRLYNTGLMDIFIEDAIIYRAGQTTPLWKMSTELMKLLPPPVSLAINVPAVLEVRTGETLAGFSGTITPAEAFQGISWSVIRPAADGGTAHITIPHVTPHVTTSGAVLTVGPLARAGDITVRASIPGVPVVVGTTQFDTVVKVIQGEGIAAGAPSDNFMVDVAGSATVAVVGGELGAADTINFADTGVITGLPAGLTPSGTFTINAAGEGTGTLTLTGTITNATLVGDHTVTITIKGFEAEFTLEVVAFVPPIYGTVITNRLVANAAEAIGFLGLAITAETVAFRETNQALDEFRALHITGASAIHGLDIIIWSPDAWPNRISLGQRGVVTPGDPYTLKVEGYAVTETAVPFVIHPQNGDPVTQATYQITSAAFQHSAALTIPASGDTRVRLHINDATTQLRLTKVTIEDEGENVVWCLETVLMSPDGGLTQAPTAVNITPSEHSFVAGVGGTQQFTAAVLPIGAQPSAVTWAIDDTAPTGVSINATGLLTVTTVAAATGANPIVVRATVTGTAITNTANVEIAAATDPRIDITGAPLILGITAGGESGTVVITAHNIAAPVDGTTVQFTNAVTLTPANADVTITGSIAIADGTGTGTITLAVDPDAPTSTHTATITIGAATANFTLNITSAGPALVGNAGTLDRTDLDIILGETMAELIAADHFAAVGGAVFGKAQGFVFVQNLANNASGMQILPAGLAELQPGDMLRARGRTTGTISDSRLELAGLTQGAGSGLGNEAVTPGSPWAIPAAFTFTYELDSAAIQDGLRIAPNGWSYGTSSFAERFENFGFSIDDLVVFRPVISNQVINFNLAENAGFQGLPEGDIGPNAHNGQIGTPRLTIDGGTVKVTIAEYEDRNYMYVSGRANNWCGINVTGTTPGNTIRVTGRTCENWVQGNARMQLDGVNGVPEQNNIAPGEVFTLVGTISGAVRITSNRFGSNTGTPATQSYYIYSIIIGTDLNEPAANPAETVNVAATENFWPPITGGVDELIINVPADLKFIGWGGAGPSGDWHIKAFSTSVANNNRATFVFPAGASEYTHFEVKYTLTRSDGDNFGPDNPALPMKVTVNDRAYNQWDNDNVTGFGFFESMTDGQLSFNRAITGRNQVTFEHNTHEDGSTSFQIRFDSVRFFNQ
jgi:hypothetical protein